MKINWYYVGIGVLILTAFTLLFIEFPESPKYCYEWVDGIREQFICRK